MKKEDKKIDFENLDELATLDLEGDRAQEASEPMLKLRTALKVRTNVRAGGPIGLGRQK